MPRAAFNTVKYGIDAMAPVECTKWVALTWDCTLVPACVHWASRLTMDCSGVCVFAMELLLAVFDKLLPPFTPPRPHPLLCWPKIGAHLQKHLKWPKIKQITTSKLYYNRLISPVLQNKVGLTQAKAGYTN